MAQSREITAHCVLIHKTLSAFAVFLDRLFFYVTTRFLHCYPRYTVKHLGVSVIAGKAKADVIHSDCGLNVWVCR